MQILLAALDGDPGKPRLVRYKSKDRDEAINFTGSIIAISNVRLRRDPVTDALVSRISVLDHNPTDDQIVAFMRQQALKGYEDLTPTECCEVVEFVVQASRQNDYQLDMRWMTPLHLPQPRSLYLVRSLTF